MSHNWDHRASQSHYDHKRNYDDYSRGGGYQHYDTPSSKRYRPSPPPLDRDYSNFGRPPPQPDLRNDLRASVSKDRIDHYPPDQNGHNDPRAPILYSSYKTNSTPYPPHPSLSPQPPSKTPNFLPQPPAPPQHIPRRFSRSPPRPVPSPHPTNSYPPNSYPSTPHAIPHSPLTRSHSPPKSPFSRFATTGCCGGGTFGKVWSAIETATGRTVALKQIKKTGTEGFPRTAIREIKIMKSSLHPNILSVSEVVWSDSGDVYLVMDFYDFDLRKLLEKHRVEFTPPEIKYLLKQLADGVWYLHEQHLLHRDLKTENILINMQGQLKICDFGLARKIEEGPKQYTPVVVTLWYRSPELLLGEILESIRPYKFEIDQWSVGCIFAELIRSSVLFAGTNSFEQAQRIFSIMGTPTPENWPAYFDYPKREKYQFKHQPPCLRKLFAPSELTESGFNLLESLLTLDPTKRLSSDETVRHPYFLEEPRPVTLIDIRSKKTTASHKKHIPS